MEQKFRYGVLPKSEQDRAYCQVKGDAGLYQVSHYDDDNKLVTISGSARDGEVKPLGVIRFVSAKRIEVLEDIKLAYKKRTELHYQVGTKIKEVKSKSLNTKFTLKSAIVSFSDGLDVSVDDATFVITNDDNAVLFCGPRTSLVKSLSEFSGPIPDGIFALAYGLEIGSKYRFYDPLSTPETTDIVIRSMSKDTIYYSLSKKDGTFSQVIKQLPVSMVAAIKA